MEFLKNLSIRTKLFLISVIPSLGLIYLLQDSISESLDRKEVTTRVYQECEEVERISGLIHQFQRERGLSLNFLASHLEEDKDKIIEQEDITNESVASVRDIYASHQKQSTIFPLLDSLSILRDDIHSYPEELNRVKSVLLDEISATTRLSQNPEIKNQLEAHVFLLYTKEFFSRTRNILLPAVVDRNFGKGEFARFSESKGQYELSLGKFVNCASADLLNFYKKRSARAAIKEFHITIDSLSDNPGYIKKTDPAEWWNKATVGVDALGEIENYSLLKIREKAEAELAAINRSVITNLAFGLFVLTLITVLVALTIRQIVFSIAELKHAAQKLAEGEVEFAVNVSSRDEMGDLVVSFNKMVSVIKAYAETAEKIGKGDYNTTVLVRSSSD